MSDRKKPGVEFGVSVRPTRALLIVGIAFVGSATGALVALHAAVQLLNRTDLPGQSRLIEDFQDGVAAGKIIAIDGAVVGVIMHLAAIVLTRLTRLRAIP